MDTILLCVVMIAIVYALGILIIGALWGMTKWAIRTVFKVAFFPLTWIGGKLMNLLG